jgi:hypothetical protein
MAGSYRAGRLNGLPAGPPACLLACLDCLELAKTNSHIMEAAACASHHAKTFFCICLLSPVIML